MNKEYLTLEKLHDGLQCQKDIRLKLGVLAVNTGYMTADDADKINEAQKRSDKRFGEFLNLHNGIFLVNMSNEGIELEMTPQEVYSNIRVDNVYKVSIELSFGKINILIKED